MFRCTLKHETELNLVALKMEEESFFESWEETDFPTSSSNLENPLFQTWDIYGRFLFNVKTNLRRRVGKKIYGNFCFLWFSVIFSVIKKITALSFDIYVIHTQGHSWLISLNSRYYFWNSFQWERIFSIRFNLFGITLW